ncbi:MAG: AAA family ATPase, partial [Pseudomonadota bacterium]
EKPLPPAVTPTPYEALPEGPVSQSEAPGADGIDVPNDGGSTLSTGATEALAARAPSREPHPDGGKEIAVDLHWTGGREQRRFFEDAELHSIYSRASAYLRAGVAVQFKGPAGMGKTAMALRVGRGIGRPMSLLTGHAQMTPEDLIGRETGQRTSRLDDKYIASVRRTETQTRPDWMEGALVAAMSQGHTLIFDEFTRAPPEANVALLSVLEEKVLVVAHPSDGRQILRAHPEFRLILTSNPADYRGTREAPDALLDRIVTFDFTELPPDTESRIVASATGIAPTDAARIVSLLRPLRRPDGKGIGVSMRTAILVARLLQSEDIPTDPNDARFVQVCADVLRGRLPQSDTEEVVRQICASAAPLARRGSTVAAPVRAQRSAP